MFTSVTERLGFDFLLHRDLAIYVGWLPCLSYCFMFERRKNIWMLHGLNPSEQPMAFLCSFGHISLKVPNVKFDFNVSVAKHRYQTSKSKWWGHDMFHLHAIIRPNHFNFNVRFSGISALMSKTKHWSRIQCWVLSVIHAFDHIFWLVLPFGAFGEYWTWKILLHENIWCKGTFCNSVKCCSAIRNIHFITNGFFSYRAISLKSRNRGSEAQNEIQSIQRGFLRW